MEKSLTRQYQEFNEDSNLNSAILFLFQLPFSELSQEMQQAIIFYKNTYSKNYKEVGECRVRQYFKECLCLEINEWIKFNEEIDKIL